MSQSVTEQLQDTTDELVDKNVDSTETELRYAAYGARLRTAVRAGSRYIAYTSDLGEAMRPLVKPYIVTSAYAISWIYLSGDVAYETYKAQRQGPTPEEAANFSEHTRLGLVATKRATFQSIASMALPAFTIHTAVAQSRKFYHKSKSPRIKTWGPTLTGLAIVPVLPYLFDEPVEHVVDKAFDWIEHKFIEQRGEPKTEL